MNSTARPIKIECSQSKLSPKITVVRLKGNLDAPSAIKLSDLCEKLISEKKTYIVMEMSHLQFISSPAVGSLMGAKRRLVEHRGNLVLVGVKSDIKAKLTLMGVDKIFTFYANLRSAVLRFAWEYEKQEEGIQIAFPSDLAYVPAIRRFISQIASQKGYSRKDAFRIETIIDEICNNAVEHGNNSDPELQVKVRCGISYDKFDFFVTNRTNKDKIPQIQKFIDTANEKLESEAGSRGRGLLLIKKLVKELKVEVTDHGTNVHITKMRED